MRGSHGELQAKVRIEGIIPAHAGLTPARLAAVAYVPGSSPRMRGSQPLTQVILDRDRIIPAHAGLTRHVFCLMQSNRDHPRACGAHVPLSR